MSKDSDFYIQLIVISDNYKHFDYFFKNKVD